MRILPHFFTAKFAKIFLILSDSKKVRSQTFTRRTLSKFKTLTKLKQIFNQIMDFRNITVLRDFKFEHSY